MRKIQRAVRAARTLLETAGVRRLPVDIYKLALSRADVVEKSMPDAISGMLIPAEQPRRHVIVVNQSHAEVRKRFTVAHELGHLLLHDYRSPHADMGFKVRFRAHVEYDGSISEEIEANRFAAEILMPAKLLKDRIAALDLEYTGDDEGDAVGRLARQFKVSKQALQIRLSDFL